MKKQFFFSMLAAAAMMASCSSENAVAPEAGGNEYGLIEGQPAFINIGIAMPSSAQTRANDNFADGVAEEYAVKSGKLVLFRGTSEADAVVFASYDIPAGTWSPDGGNQITTTRQDFVQEITSPKLSGSQKLFAYVMLNYAGNDTGVDWTTNTPFTTFKTQVLQAIGIENESDGYGNENSNGFVMTNSPIALKQGGSLDPTGAEIVTLTPIDPSAIYSTAAAASAGTAVACIYVERAAVKVQVDWATSIADPAGSTTPVSFEGWTLGNVNTGGGTGSGYFNTRNVEQDWFPLFNASTSVPAANKYRFVSNSPLNSSIGSNHYLGYRTYFGKDVNYVADATNLVGTKVAASAHSLTKGGITYTYENTFDEDHQTYRNTTYVSFKTTINGGSTFYTVASQPNTALNSTNVLNKLAAINDADHGTEIAAIATNIAAKIDANRSVIGSLTGTIVVKLGHTVALTGSRESATGKRTYSDKLAITSVTVSGSEVYSTYKTGIDALEYSSGVSISDLLAQELAGISYTPEVVYEYLNGVSYYTARIGHFWNTETPWSAPESAANDYSKIYPSTGTSLDASPVNYGASRKAAWLGRWGIVRNNWYELTVSDINGIGDAEPVDYTGTIGNTPDDNPEPKYYIKAHIHILPWVKRTQNVIL